MRQDRIQARQRVLISGDLGYVSIFYVSFFECFRFFLSNAFTFLRSVVHHVMSEIMARELAIGLNAYF